MKVRRKTVRQSPLAIAFVLFMSSAVTPTAFAQMPTVGGDAGLLRVQKSLQNPGLVDDLFPPDTGTPGTGTGTNPGTGTGTGTGTGGSWDPNNGYCMFSNCNNGTGGLGTGTGTSYGTGYGTGYGSSYGSGYGDYGQYGQYGSGYYGGYYGYDPRRMDRAMVGAEFQCNLFENTPLAEVLSSLTALGAAVNKPDCQGTQGLQGMQADNQKIVEAVTALRPYVENPDAITQDQIPNISNAVDIAVQSATNLALSFNSSALSQDCRKSMGPGQVATSLNNVINGLTPYALMAAQLSGIPGASMFVLGGSALTGAIGSMAQIIDNNTVNMGDPLVLQAVTENTCQYIRLEQKYNFLIGKRSEQIQRINQEVNMAKSLFSAKIKGVSPEANALVARRSAIEQTTRELNYNVGMVTGQFQADKMYFKTATDPMTTCNFGVAVANKMDDRTFYGTVMLGSLDQAMVAFGKSTGVQGETLKSNATTAVRQLKDYASKSSPTADDTKACATAATTLVRTMEDSVSSAKNLLKLAKSNVETQLTRSKDFGMLRASLGALDQKKIQADRVAGSVDNIKKFATDVTKSQINEAMANIRRSLLARNKGFFKSPVEKWFDHMKILHQSDITDFSSGLQKLRNRAFTLTATYNNRRPDPNAKLSVPDQLRQDRKDADQLKTFNLKTVPLETTLHRDVCRELRDVWGHWRKGIDHLATMNSFCDLLEPYIFDNRPEDRQLVAICRSNPSKPKGPNGIAMSDIRAIKDDLVKSNKKGWALYLSSKMDELVCLDPVSPLGPINPSPANGGTTTPGGFPNGTPGGTTGGTPGTTPPNNDPFPPSNFPSGTVN